MANFFILLSFLVVCHDSIRGCVLPSVGPFVGPSVGPSVRRSVTRFFRSAKNGWKRIKMRSVMTRRAEIIRVTTYFVYTNLFSFTLSSLHFAFLRFLRSSAPNQICLNGKKLFPTPKADGGIA